MNIKEFVEEGMHCIEWVNDCQGKKDFDGDVLRVSSRYWPRGGGYHTLSPSGEWAGNESRPEIRPHASSTILFFDKEIARERFEANTEEEVKALVEAWVRTQLESLAEHLGKWSQVR